MKNWTVGGIAGGLAGLIGAWMISEGISLLWVVIVGALIGFGVGVAGKLKKKRK